VSRWRLQWRFASARRSHQKLSREISRGGPQKIEKKFAPAALEKRAATRGLEGESWEMAERGKNGQMHSQTRGGSGGKKCSEPFSCLLK